MPTTLAHRALRLRRLHAELLTRVSCMGVLVAAIYTMRHFPAAVTAPWTVPWIWQLLRVALRLLELITMRMAVASRVKVAGVD